MLGVIIGILVFAIPVALTFIGVRIWDKIDDHREATRKAKYPELYKAFQEVNDKGVEICHFYNEQIAPRKREVDRILEDWNYYPEEVKKVEEEELERLRQEIFNAEIHHKALQVKQQELRDWIHNYIYATNLEWAKKRGW